ncbi:hypothetical protein JRI60_01560 [Archangium violaceum]|uniref:hypothetical protein n=1 Tax=Archangium violaceum TaxID=83451 RepID=UPI0019521593|nr:hypothetical protein [Archangium violaceum]QRN97799.1 hypothetical protein JRI60_01560 [Archangium violaceum]
METTSSQFVPGEILEQLTLGYLERRWTRFYPSQFTAAQLGTEEQIVKTLMGLSEAQFLIVKVTLFCDEGHDFWRGPYEILPKQAGRTCPYCDETAPEECENMELEFELAPSWRAQLDKSQKKTPTFRL